MLNDKVASRINSYWYNPEELKRTYGVILNTEDSSKKSKMQVHYEIEVLLVKKRIDNSFVFELRKKEVFINEKRPNLFFDTLADQCGKVIYPIKVLVSPYGEVIKVFNHKEIKDRWSQQRILLEKRYKGDEVTLMLDQMSIAINSFQKINTIIKEDWFFTLFFNSIHGGYGRPMHKVIQPLAVFPYSPPVLFEVIQTVREDIKRKGVLIYEQKGHCVDERNEKEMKRGKRISFFQKNGNEKVKGSIAIDYEIYKDSSVFDAIRGSSMLKFSSGNSKKVSVEIYNLKNKIPKTSLEKEIQNEEIENNNPKPKKHYSLFGRRKKR